MIKTITYDDSKWKLVPLASHMIDEQAEAISKSANCCGGIAFDIYIAALAAAPQPEQQPVQAIDEREAFEYAERASNLSRDEDDPDSYLNPCVQSAWEGWQARAALSPRMEAKQASRNSYQPVGKETA